MTVFIRRLRVLSVLALLPVLTACSALFNDQDGVFRDRSNDYRQAQLDSPLRIPETLDDDDIDDSYAVPAIDDRLSLDGEFKVPRPEPLGDAIERDAVRINKLGNQQWILVDGTPGQVWPRLWGFFNLNQIPVLRADANNGILETAWMQPKQEGVLKERFRLRIDQGVQRGSSEVYILHADSRAGDSWPSYSSAVERENILIQELAQYLADSAAAASVSMLVQQAIDSSGKVYLEQDDKEQPYIKLQLPFARAWASLRRAIEKSGYELDDLNRDQKLFYVRYIKRDADDDDDDQEPGFFASLFAWGEETSPQQKPGIAYRVMVREDNKQQVSIRIERQSGEAMLKGEAEHLLKRIKRHLT